MNVISRAILDMETLSSVHLASGNRTSFERLSLQPNFSYGNENVWKRTEFPRPSSQQEVRVFPGDENKYRSFQENARGSQQQSSSYRQSWRERIGWNFNPPPLPSISCKRKRDTPRWVEGRNVDVASGLRDSSLLFVALSPRVSRYRHLFCNSRG